MVGYILIGIIFGPHGLGLIREAEEIQHLSELGILLLLFIVGLELDLHKFLPVWKVSIGTAVLQVGFGLLAMFGLSLLFDWPMEMVIVLGFVVSLSSTAVAIKLLTDMNALNSSVGNVAVGILIAQDLAVIPMILIVSAIGGASTGENFLIGLIAPEILLLVTAFLVWTLVKRPPWLKRFSNITDRIQYALEHDRQRPLTAIMFCFAAGAISGGLGFSAAYGAFIAGLILGNSKYGHSYERQVRPLFDILMMFFFLSMGMLIDFHYLMDNIVSVVVLLFVVMFLKTVINIGILRMFSLSKRNSTFIGATLGQVGEFSFALAALGLSRGAIDNDVYKMVAVVVALSLIATPAWLHTMRRVSAIKRYTLRKRRRVAVTPV